MQDGHVLQVGCVLAEVMLTPSFDIEQNDEFVILTIRVPYIKVGMYAHGCKPCSPQAQWAGHGHVAACMQYT